MVVTGCELLSNSLHFTNYVKSSIPVTNISSLPYSCSFLGIYSNHRLSHYSYSLPGYSVAPMAFRRQAGKMLWVHDHLDCTQPMAHTGIHYLRRSFDCLNIILMGKNWQSVTPEAILTFAYRKQPLSGHATSSMPKVTNGAKSDIHLILQLCNSFQPFHVYNKTSFNCPMQLSWGKIYSNMKNIKNLGLVTKLPNQHLDQVFCQLLVWQCPNKY